MSRERMTVAGFSRVKTFTELKNVSMSDTLIASKQFGRKAGKHMQEWGLSPSSTGDRQAFKALIRGIIDHPTETRRVQWLLNKETNRRTTEVTAFIKGNDVVLVDDSNAYITIMKDGVYNRRVKNGRKEQP